VGVALGVVDAVGVGVLDGVGLGVLEGLGVEVDVVEGGGKVGPPPERLIRTTHIGLKQFP
jgi:hypothetical protein